MTPYDVYVSGPALPVSAPHLTADHHQTPLCQGEAADALLPHSPLTPATAENKENYVKPVANTDTLIWTQSVIANLYWIIHEEQIKVHIWQMKARGLFQYWDVIWPG